LATEVCAAVSCSSHGWATMVDFTRYIFRTNESYPGSAERIPFSARVMMPGLTCLLDPQTQLDEISEGYFQLLRRPSVSDHVQIEVSTLSLSDSAPAEASIWRLTSTTADAYQFERRSTESVRHTASIPRSPAMLAAFMAHGDHDYSDALPRFMSWELALESEEIGLLITDREPIGGFGVRQDVIICCPDDAMALVGLHQRLTGTVVTVQDGRPTLQRPDWIGHLATRALVPELMNASRSISDTLEGPAALLGSAKLRLERTLSARDELLARGLMGTRYLPFAHPQDLLERIALGLMAMFDATARAMNQHYAMNLAPSGCSFRRSTFTSKLPAEIKNVVDQDPFRASLQAVAILRNTIHADHLGIGTWGSGARDFMEHVAYVPRSVSTAFVTSCTALGVRDRWIRELPGYEHPGGTAVLAVRVGDELLQLALRSLRSLLAPVAAMRPFEDRDVHYSEAPDLLATLLKLYGFPADW
jgi:hypothetical protein